MWHLFEGLFKRTEMPERLSKTKKLMGGVCNISDRVLIQNRSISKILIKTIMHRLGKNVAV